MELKNFFNKFPEFILAHLRLAFVIISILLIFLAGISFYYYGYLVVNTVPDVDIEKISIGEDLYKKVLNDINVRAVYKLPAKEYKNPFVR